MNFDPKKVIEIAQKEIGYREKASNSDLDSLTGNSGSGNWNKYARDIDQKYPNWYNGKKNGYEWCDVFVDWCFIQAYGYDNARYLLCQPEKSLGAGCTWSAQYFAKYGRFVKDPQPGDQIFFGSGIQDCDHTGIVEKVGTKKVYTIEGNTSNRVARREYALQDSSIAGYGRPRWDGDNQTSGNKETNESKETGEKTVVVNLTMLMKGSKGAEVKTVQRLLRCMNYSIGAAGVDGDFGPDTEAAVKAFQRHKGISVDGIVGADTWTKLLK